MTQRSMLWDGIVGDGGPYDSSDVMDGIFRSITGCTGNRGVLFNWLDSLLVSGTSSPITVATGAALIYGMFYENDDAVSVSVPLPSSIITDADLSRYDRVVLRRDWPTQTVRIARVAGTAAISPAIPALTQSVGSIYEIPLATILITGAGEITVTDTREYAAYTTDWPANTVTAGMYVEGAITADKIPNRTRSETKGSGQLEADATTPPTWTVGASYDYWAFADAATNAVWVYFLIPESYVDGTLAFYVWSVPDVNGAGIGVEDVRWTYSVYYNVGDSPTLINATGVVLVDQQLRVNTTVYRDQLFTIATSVATKGAIVALYVDRTGGHGGDSYASTMRGLAIEMEYTADA